MHISTSYTSLYHDSLNPSKLLWFPSVISTSFVQKLDYYLRLFNLFILLLQGEEDINAYDLSRLQKPIDPDLDSLNGPAKKWPDLNTTSRAGNTRILPIDSWLTLFSSSERKLENVEVWLRQAIFSFWQSNGTLCGLKLCFCD